MLPLLPALLAALSGAWCGTFSGGAGWGGATVAAALPLLLLLGSGAAGVDLRDPLRLGRSGRFLPAALWIAIAASAWASPVPRAGRVALILLPAYLALPGAVARCWSSEPARRIGLRALSGVLGGVALAALGGIVWLHTARASLPLGHHNLLAAFLVTLLPLALLPGREPNGWHWVGWGSGAAAVVAVLASRSLLGIAALGLEVLAGVTLGLGGSRPAGHPPPVLPPFPPTTPPRGEGPSAEGVFESGATAPVWGNEGLGRRRSLLSRPSPLGGVVGGDGGRTGGGWNRGAWLASAAALLPLLALVGPRALQILSGVDRSGQARAVYYQAGWEGFLARPALGWGPGSTPWTIALFLHPRPGLNPPGEIVGELHSLPLGLAYELGIPGLLLSGSLIALFFLRRIAERRAATDLPLLTSGLLGLLGAAVVSLGSASLAVTALPLAAGIAAGAALAGSPAPEREARRLPALAYATAAALFLAPLLLAGYHYDRARSAASPRAIQAHLARAAALDPSFPLYQARLGWLLAATDRGRGADLSLRAAEAAPGMSPFWLAAGVLGWGAGRPWSPQAFDRACERDPLSPFAPWFAALAAPRSSEAPGELAHALLAEPRLLTSSFLDAHPHLRAAALREASSRAGIDPGWRKALLEAADRQFPNPTPDAERGWLALEIDETPPLSLSLYAFRRRPWPLEWPLVEIAEVRLAPLDLPPASELPASSAAAFRCRPLNVRPGVPSP